MNGKATYELLLSGIDCEARVERIVRGVSWTAALLSDGQAGVAMRTAGESFPRSFKTLKGLPVKEAARAVLSWNLEEASEGMAVINACYNRPERMERLGCFYTDSALEGIELRGKTVGFVGHLLHQGSVTERLVAAAKAYFILEREPKPGDYPDAACEYLLPGCDAAVITGSAWVNKTMPRLLELAKDAVTILTGPTVPLCPALFSLGVDRLNGQVITEPEGMLDAIAAKRCSVNAFSRHWTLDAR